MRVSGISLTLRIRTVCQALLLALLLLLLLLGWLRLSSLGQYGAEHKCHQVSAVFAHSQGSATNAATQAAGNVIYKTI